MNAKAFLFVILIGIVMFSAGCAGTGPTPGPVVDYSSLVANLRAAGATVEPAGQLSQPFFTGRGRLIKVNGEDVQVFEYSDKAKAESEASLVSPDGSTIGTSSPLWVGPPHFYKAGRIIVLYVGENKTVLDLLESALGPQFAGKSEIQISMAPIEEVRVSFAKSLPPQVIVYIRGGLADSCTTYRDAKTERSGNIINIEVTVQRPKDAICAEVYTTFEKNINLGSDFTAGQTYTVKVNNAEPVTFVMQ